MVESVRGRRLPAYTRRLLENPSDEQIHHVSRDLLTSAVDEALISRCGALTDSPG